MKNDSQYTCISSFDLNACYNFIKKMPGFFLIKDINSIVFGMNEAYEHSLGFKKPGDAIGKNDFDAPCASVELAEHFIKLDQRTIKSGKKTSTIDIVNYADGWHCLLGERLPINDRNNNVVGIFSHGIDLAQTNLQQVFALFKSDKKFARRNISYLLDNYFSELPLTKRQYECLFFLVRGKSTKEIAKILNLSPRTVEEHLDNIKANLMCQTKSQVIEKAIDSGFIYFIPKVLVDNKMIAAKD